MKCGGPARHLHVTRSQPINIGLSRASQFQIPATPKGDCPYMQRVQSKRCAYDQFHIGLQCTGNYFTAITCIDLEGTRNYFTARRSWLTTWFLSLSCPLYLVSNSSGREETFAVQQQREASTGFASCPVVTFWPGTRTSGPEAGSTWKRMNIWIAYLASVSLATSVSAT